MMGYLFSAYTLVWIGIFLYILSLSRRQRKLSEELRRIKWKDRRP